MNKKEDIEQYFIDLFKITNNTSFNKFISTIYSYNINKNYYNKSFLFDLKLTLFNCIDDSLDEKPDIKYWDYLDSSNIFIIYDKDYSYFSKITLDFPIYPNDLNIATPTIIKFLIYNKITSKITIYNKFKNPSFSVEVYSIIDLNKILSFFNTNNKLTNISKFSVLPFLIQENGIGIYSEYDPFDFKNEYIKLLYEYFSTCFNEKEVSIHKFSEFIVKKYRFEVNFNRRRMLSYIINYIYQYNNIENYRVLFDTSTIMNIGSYNHKDFILKEKENGFIEFYDNNDSNIILSFGSLDYLNIIYSKFYDNYIKLEKSGTYFKLFSDIYDRILSSNFRDVKLLNKLINDKMNDIYKQMIIFSSGYFAYKKLNLPLNLVNDILLDFFNTLE